MALVPYYGSSKLFRIANSLAPTPIAAAVDTGTAPSTSASTDNLPACALPREGRGYRFSGMAVQRGHFTYVQSAYHKPRQLAVSVGDEVVVKPRSRGSHEAMAAAASSSGIVASVIVSKTGSGRMIEVLLYSDSTAPVNELTDASASAPHRRATAVKQRSPFMLSRSHTSNR